MVLVMPDMGKHSARKDISIPLIFGEIIVSAQTTLNNGMCENNCFNTKSSQKVFQTQFIFIIKGYLSQKKIMIKMTWNHFCHSPNCLG